MNLKSLQGRLGFLFLAFVLLVIVSVAATFWGIESQERDALVINLAGRQRMLVEQMSRLALISMLSASDQPGEALQESIRMFDETLAALRYGGQAPYLPGEMVTIPATRDAGILAQLEHVSLLWSEYRASLNNVLNLSPDSADRAAALDELNLHSVTLVQQADATVRMYEAAANEKMARLRIIQTGFFVSALVLLALGGWVTRLSVLKPITKLQQVAERIGSRDLHTPVRVTGPNEIEVLSEAFESMRKGLQQSQAELVELADSLEQRVVQRTRELDALNDVSREISSRLDVQHVLNSVTEKAHSLLGGEVASLCLLDESGSWLRLHALSGPESAVIGEQAASDDGLAESVLTGREAMLCSSDKCSGGCRILSEPYRTSHLAAPLRIGDRVIGALCVGSPRRDHFAQEAAGILTKLANTAAIALENARLYAQAERLATLEERRRIAAEMHDGLAQTLSYLGLMTDQVVDFLAEGQKGQALKRLERTRETINHATSEVRSAINQLMDESPVSRDLNERLEILIEEFSEKHNLSVEWHNELDEAPDCSREVVEQVVNVTSEALINVRRHAQASRASVVLSRQDHQLMVAIEDDGNGFDLQKPFEGSQGHFGLKIMQARAAHIGGTIETESKPGSGTRVTLTWPETIQE